MFGTQDNKTDKVEFTKSQQDYFLKWATIDRNATLEKVGGGYY